MLRAAVQNIESLSPKLSFVTLITGTKVCCLFLTTWRYYCSPNYFLPQAYGVYLLDKFPFRGQIPLKEDLPRVPAEYAKDLFYYHEVDLLHEISEGKSWSWCEVRPDVIVCFQPVRTSCRISCWNSPSRSVSLLLVMRIAWPKQWVSILACTVP